MNDDIKAALSFLSRVAVDHDIPFDTLAELLSKSYEDAARRGKRKDPSRGVKFEPALEGSFVEYWDPKKGKLSAHVLRVGSKGHLDLRVHQVAQPDYNRDNVPYSAKLKKDHWSYR